MLTMDETLQAIKRAGKAKYNDAGVMP